MYPISMGRPPPGLKKIPQNLPKFSILIPSGQKKSQREKVKKYPGQTLDDCWSDVRSKKCIYADLKPAF